jgi:hypothetical protein
LLLSAGIEIAFAQSDFRSGYIVTAKGDTVTGWIDNRNESRLASECLFKPSQTGTVAVYTPADLLAFGFQAGKMYETRKIPADTSPGEQVFMEKLVHGTISLFHYKANDRFYVEKKGHELTALTQTERTIERDGKQFVEIKRNYLGVLNYLMNDCPSLRKKILSVALEYHPLTTLVSRYNVCQGDEKNVRSQRRHIVVKGGLTAGSQLTVARFNTTLPEYTYLTQHRFSSKPALLGGAFVQTTLPWVTEKVSVWLEAYYSSTYYHIDWSRTNSGYYNNNTYLEEAKFRLRYIRLPAMLRYTYPKGNLRPFVQAGVNTDFLTHYSSYLIRETQVTHTDQTKRVSTWEGPIFTPYQGQVRALSQVQMHGTLGIGAEQRISGKLRWFAEIRASRGSTMVEPTASPNFRARTNTFSLHTGIGF